MSRKHIIALLVALSVLGEAVPQVTRYLHTQTQQSTVYYND
jgi:hypothetical protein